MARREALDPVYPFGENESSIELELKTALYS